MSSANDNGRSIEILQVEDNPVDARLVLEAMREAELRNRIHIVEDCLRRIDRLIEDTLARSRTNTASRSPEAVDSTEGLPVLKADRSQRVT